MGAHAIRSPILPELPGIRLPDVVERYHEMLAAGNAPAVLEQCDADGLVREATGEQGRAPWPGRAAAVLPGLCASGGIAMERCSLTDDGTSCALEYNLTAAVRLYDDVERPASFPPVY